MEQNIPNHIRILLENEFEKINKINPQPKHIINTVYSMLKCRTHEYGGHVYACPDGHYAIIHFNSCKKRNCPTCQGIEIKYWEEVQKERLLNTEHHHIVIKNPKQMNSGFISNYKQYATLLLDASRDTIKSMYGKGIQPGAIATLHTHGKNNEIHPHVHLAVTNGGADKNLDYKIIPNEKINNKELSIQFNKIYLRKLKRRIKDNKINIDPEKQLELFRGISKNKGNIFSSLEHSSGEFLIKYLAKYSKGGAIKNYNITDISNNVVTYFYKDKNNNKIIRKINIETFVRRFLYHIPPDGFKIIRYYGLYCPASKEKYNIIREKLGQDKYEKPSRSELRDKEPAKCPVCQKKLTQTDSFEPNAIPVSIYRLFNFKLDIIKSQFLEAKEQYRGIKFLFIKNKLTNQKVANRIV